MSKQLNSWFECRKNELMIAGHRQLIVLVGDLDWALAYFGQLSAQSDDKQAFTNLLVTDFVLSEQQHAEQLARSVEVTNKNHRQLLGSEYQHILLAAQSFNPEAFAALSGTLVAGGSLFLLLSPAEYQEPSYFLQRFLILLKQQVGNGVYLLRQGDEKDLIADFAGADFGSQTQSQGLPKCDDNRAHELSGEFAYQCATADQVKAVEAIIRQVSGHRHRPLVLTADRGRGKSTALALACVELLNDVDEKNATGGVIDIVVCAPQLAALQVFFRQLSINLPEAKVCLQTGTCQYQGSTITFYPIDKLLLDKPKCQLLMVDEAASIPVYLLTKLLANYHRIVFASTVHGYEGAGRGFAIKFKKVLNEHYPNWRSLEMTQAIRWREGDPLENFVNRSCLLDASLAAANCQQFSQANIDTLSMRLVTPSELLAQPYLLEQVLAILVTAHYQTSPNDLQLILDNPKAQLLVLKTESANIEQVQVVAVTLLLSEGANSGISESEINGVIDGRRRLKDQFTPQSLINHCGLFSAFDWQYLRVLRIAVHPDCQGLGIGRYFLGKITRFAKQQGGDVLSTSFGLNSELLWFWQRAGFSLARIGFSQDQASGEYSGLLLKALNDSSAEFAGIATTGFYQQLPYLLAQQYQHLSANLVAVVASAWPQSVLPVLTELEEYQISAFAEGKMQYDSCAYALQHWLIIHLVELAKQLKPTAQNSTTSVLPLIKRLLIRASVAEICAEFGFTGKKTLNQYLIDYVKRHYSRTTRITST
ncbi:tRNA(Met) cytidine acetyltransferase [Endozoicomonas sp. G2_1]|uniref:GNAT family N-acetyltransferase n=1 Tax=Endozoicomonas sp. G2_1 TaxID=2821091 RepID=UPI001ADC061F|nr:GNAT family N-acetyltransferase [Endozoicomonas sp. G2_1]MBO9490064.1 tRNA(Met) cytidine acetyltransferase [Endozoicomonas sp. G2_1]